MGIRVLRIIEIEYPDMASFDDDRVRWYLPENGVFVPSGGHGMKTYRTATIIAPLDAPKEDPLCVVCGRDNRNGTHDALQKTGHLSHDFAEVIDDGN